MSRRAALALGLLLVGSGCLESPFAPAPTRHRCGALADPCPLPCDLDCTAVTVEAAAACMLTLEGELDPSRTVCRFADRSEVRFGAPLPLAGEELQRHAWAITLRRRGEPCLVLRSEPLPWRGGGSPARTTVEGPLGAFSQEVWREPADGGLTGEGARLLLGCPDGRHYAAEGSGACTVCADGGCRQPHLLELQVRREVSFEFTLRSGSRITPLFTCR